MKKKTKPVKHAKSRHATATSWKPGVSGNPLGRPRVGNSLAETLRDFLDEPGTGGNGGRKRQLIARLFQAATAKNLSVAAAKLLIETATDLDFTSRLAALEERVSQLMALKVV